MLCNPELS